MTVQSDIKDYEQNWSALNVRLKEIERQQGGLDAALTALEAHQIESGFIKANLSDIERLTLHHPYDPEKFFRVQYNPVRALRFKGSGFRSQSSTPPNTHQACFLCRDNIIWQQQGLEMGYEINADGTEFYAWMNPFPLLQKHIVLATREHRSQEWPIVTRGEPDASNMLKNLIELARRLPGYIGFYNGVSAGASIPSHLHFQFFKRPANEKEFPLERCARLHFESGDKNIIMKNYPMPAAVWKGAPHSVSAEVAHWISQWAKTNQERINGLTANFIVMSDHASQEVTIFFVPRDRTKSRTENLSGVIGGLEVLGELVLSTPEEKAKLDAGEIDYFALEKVLASVATPFYVN
jgi:hypothetical protein